LTASIGGVPTPQPPGPRFGVAFLLAQLGSFAAERFAHALDEHDVTPPLVGILRLLLVEPGPSQQQLAERLGMVPSRMVSYIDDLESRGWITRVRDTVDRRVNIVTLTEAGRDALTSIGAVSRAHDKAITAALDVVEYATLRELLGKLAAAHQLVPGIHPGYRNL
jgi:DNA-binding MarR family transcriptional regulator